MKKHFSLALLFTVFCIQVPAQQVQIYPVPKALLYSRHNDDYTVKVRSPGGEWQDLFEYNVKVDLDNPQNASMVQFDFSGQVEVFVKKNNGMLQNVQIRPLNNKIEPTVKGNTVTFTLNKPQNLSIEFNGDRLHNLHLFSNVIEKDVPKKDDPNVIYFAPGVHTPSDSSGIQYNIPSNTTVYLAPGAIVKGKLVCDRVENVRIIGRGMIDQAQRGIEVTHSKNVLIDGITVVNPDHYTVYGGESSGVTIRNLKSFSCKGWSDGLDLMSCSDVLIDNVFMRNSDDCIAIYGHRWNFYGGVRNVTVQNSVLWADVAHPTNIGLHGDTSGEGDIIEDIHFKNIDILEQDEDDPDYQGCMAICAGDKNLIRNVTYEDIRVESIQEGQLFHLEVVFNPKYNTGAGRNIENILFKNVSYDGLGENTSLIKGLSKNGKVDTVTFENIVINGKRLTSSDKEFIKIGDAVQHVKFK